MLIHCFINIFIESSFFLIINALLKLLNSSITVVPCTWFKVMKTNRYRLIEICDFGKIHNRSGSRFFKWFTIFILRYNISNTFTYLLYFYLLLLPFTYFYLFPQLFLSITADLLASTTKISFLSRSSVIKTIFTFSHSSRSSSKTFTDCVL